MSNTQLDLAAWRLRLDVLASEASQALKQVGIPHCLIKGPTTAHWLYEPPRHYRDVDILVPRSRLRMAAKRLERQGIATPTLGKYGEGATHSLTMRATSSGGELDLHVSLPLVSIDGCDPDKVWRVLVPYVVDWRLEGIEEPVPALDVPAKCLVVALHYVSDAGQGSAGEDLRRAAAKASEDDWNTARRLAKELGVADVVEAALDLAANHGTADVTHQLAQLKLQHAPASSLRLAQVRAAPWRERPAMIWREIVPSRDFMRYAGWPSDTTRELVDSHIKRWRRLAAEVSSERRRRRGDARGL